ncbi:CDP-alcohol phosphatidyltransferase family protein [Hasllibacter sp. MH4015]|uniref:CDP-alcohol phosphatidyltransferase family protein n=1 Tax=Hasllibacter sp. MH4015 TaxID=2854029 RepID=UPI001CD3FFC1|nr:CDP-alcohol phosphatidyltransferase family protein [Hasllibacter sp. MH4015]
MVIENKPLSAHAPQGARLPVRAFAGVGAVGALGVLGMGLISSGGALAVGLAAYAAALVVARAGLLRSYPHGILGWCNAVTLLRLALVCGLIGWLIAPPNPWLVFAVAAFAFAADGLDGWLARREGLSSGFGARFDLEVDSALALSLALHGYQSGAVGAYVILLGLPRYVFFVAQAVWPWLGADLPERFSRKVVCVVQIAALLAVLLPIAPPALAQTLAGGAALGLAWSFARDVAWLRQNGARA